MADQKKIIKVNDLIIQAENVHFEPIVREGRPVHPFFGPRPPRVEQPAVVEEEQELESETAEENSPEVETEEQVEEQPPRRPPFSWI